MFVTNASVTTQGLAAVGNVASGVGMGERALNTAFRVAHAC